MADAQTEYREHAETYAAFNKLVTFGSAWVVLLLVSMAIGLVAHLPVLGLLLGIGGSLALIVAFAILG